MILKCTKCNLEKDESEFPASESQLPARNYRGHRCNACKREIYRQRAEIVCEQQRNRYHAKRDEIIVQKRKSYKKYYHNNKEKCLTKSKQWVKDKREELAKEGKVYNQEYIKEYQAEYCKEYRKRPDVISVSRLRSRFRDWLICKGGKKTSSVLKLVGMEKHLFREYIESQFTEGMTWETIHIDHYVPLSYFDPFSEEDHMIAWNYRNLRPLLAYDNMSKRAKLPPDYLEHIEMIKKHLAVSQE